MEIADISQSVSVRTSRRAQFTSSSVRAPEPAVPAVADSGIRAVDALRAELRTALSARFFTGFSGATPGFASLAPKAGPAEVAEEAVGGARQVAAREPGRAASALVAFRATVRETVEAVRQNFEGRSDVRDVDTVERLVNRGLDGVAREAQGQTESATRVLEVESRVREASTIRIRTQEGDTVKIRFRNVESVSASDVSASGPDGSARSTRIAASQSQRVSFRIEGDINSDERAAIDDVLTQATAIADEFFDGDLSAAFENAAAFEFDAGQLQRVNLRFRIQEQRNLRLAETVVRLPTPPAAELPVAPRAPIQPTVDLAPIVNRPGPQPDAVSPSSFRPGNAPAEPVVTAPSASRPGDAPAEPVTVAPEPVAETPETPVDAGTDVDALNGFFAFVSKFLSETNVAFEVAGESGRFYFSESFKLTLLRETFVAVAPDSQADAAETAAVVVDKLLEVDAVAAETDSDGDDD